MKLFDSKHWTCRCSCGKEKTVLKSNLYSGKSKSCGCYRAETIVKRCLRHGKSYAKVYAIWAAMKNRCNNPNDKHYKDYGGRGITLCEEWLKFDNFLQDMGEPPDRLQLERIDNDKGYSKYNCKWATAAEQCRNKRNTKFLTYQNKTLTPLEWSQLTGIVASVINRRLKSGWSIERALTEAVSLSKTNRTVLHFKDFLMEVASGH